MEALPLVVAHLEMCNKIYGDTSVARFEQERRDLAGKLTEVIDVGVSKDTFVEASEPENVGLVTMNEVTGEVIAYRAEAFTMRVHWPKVFVALVGVTTSLAATSVTWIGFVGFFVAMHKAVNALGFKLTTTEADVFTAIYDNRDENGRINLDRVHSICKKSSSDGEPADDEDVDTAIDQLARLGIIELVDGSAVVMEEWVFSGKWR